MQLVDYFISYPKSGRTWLRFMYDLYLCELLQSKVSNVFEIEHEVNSQLKTKWIHLDFAAVEVKTYYEAGRIDVNRFRNKACVLIVRNIPDTLVSLYHHAYHHLRLFSGTPSEFLRHRRLGVAKICMFYATIESLRAVTDIPIVRYEDLHKDVAGSFRTLLVFIGIPIREDLIDFVTKSGNFKNMKRLSLTERYKNTFLAPADPDNPDSFKIRSGVIGSSKKFFSKEDLAFIDSAIEVLCPKGGCYDLSYNSS